MGSANKKGRIHVKGKKNEDIKNEMISEMEGLAELTISPRVPDKAVKTQDQVSSFITQILDAGEKVLEIEKSKGRSKKQIFTKVSFSYEGFDIQTKKDFSLFDQEVLDAVVSLYLADNEFISPAMVYRTMTGKTNSEYIHPGKLKEIEESIDKCMFSRLSIDASEAASVFGYGQSIYSGNLLVAEKAQVKMGGHYIVAYKIINEPLLYRYAKACKQIAAVDLYLLDTPVVKTNDNIILQGYLLRKIEHIKKDPTNNNIYYEDIYKTLLVNKESRTQVKRVRDYCNEILNYWKEKKYIHDYEIIMKGRSFHYITICLY